MDQIRASVARAGVGDVLIAYQTDIANNTENFSVTTRAFESAEKTPEAAAR